MRWVKEVRSVRTVLLLCIEGTSGSEPLPLPGRVRRATRKAEASGTAHCVGPGGSLQRSRDDDSDKRGAAGVAQRQRLSAGYRAGIHQNISLVEDLELVGNEEGIVTEGERAARPSNVVGIGEDALVAAVLLLHALAQRLLIRAPISRSAPCAARCGPR